jgi:hypothetical protein
MMVTGATQCVFSIIEGARAGDRGCPELDKGYAAELLERAMAFMLCVETMTPPVALPAVAAPVKARKDLRHDRQQSMGQRGSDVDHDTPARQGLRRL